MGQEFEDIFGSDEFSSPEIPQDAPVVTKPPPVAKPPIKALAEKSVDDELNALLAGIEEVPEEVTEKDKEDKGFWGGVVGVLGDVASGVAGAAVQTSRNVTIAKRELMGESIEDIPTNVMEEEGKGLVENITTGAIIYGAPALAGAKAGAAAGTFLGGPIGTFVGGGLGALGGAFAGAFFDDPRTKNLADVVKQSDEKIKGHLKGTPLEDMDVVVDAITENLAKHDGDDLFTKRLKNATADFVTGVALTPVAWVGEVVIKNTARAGINVVKNVVGKKGSLEAAKKATQAEVTQAAKEVVETAVDGKPSIIATGAKADGIEDGFEEFTDERAKKVLEDFEKSLEEELPNILKESVDIADDGGATVTKEIKPHLQLVTPEYMARITDESVTGSIFSTVKRFVNEYKQVRTLDREVFKQTVKAAKESLTQADKVSILKGEIEPSSDGLAKVLAYMEEVGQDYLRVLATPANGDPAILLAKQEATENLFELARVWTDVGTEQARAFGFRKILGQLALEGDEEAMRAIGSAGKFRAVKALIEKRGGEGLVESTDALALEAIRLATNPTSAKANLLKSFDIDDRIAILNETKDVLAKRDSDFMLDKAGEVIAKSPYRKGLDIFTAYISDNVLSAWSAGNAIVGGLADMTLRSTANYMKAGFRLVGSDRVEAKAAMIEANMFAGELISSFASSLRLGVNALKEGTDSQNIKAIQGATNVGQELQKGVKAILGVEEQAKHGTVLNYIAPAYGWSIGLGRKLLVGWDVAATNMARNAAIKSKLAVRGIKQGIPSDRLQEYVTREMAAGRIPKDIMDQAELLGQQWAYAAKPELVTSQAIERFMQDAPLFKVFNLFFRAKANGIERTLEYIPGAAFFLKSHRDALRAGGDALALSAAKQTVGGLLLGGGYILHEMGYATAEPPRGLRLKDYWSPDLEQGAQGRDPGQIIGPSGAFNLPIGSPMDKIVRLSGAIHQLLDAVDGDEAEALVEASSAAVASVLGDPGAYQTDLEFLYSFLSMDANKMNAATFATNQLMKVVPMRSTVQKVGQVFGQDEFLRDLNPASELGAIDYMIEHAQNRLLALYDSRGFVAQRNIMGEKLTKPKGFMGISVFSAPGGNLDPVLEGMRTIEEYAINRPNQGFVNVDFRMPSRMQQVDLFLSETGADIEAAQPRVQLPTKFYEKLLDYYAQGGGQGLTLRERLEVEVDAAMRSLQDDPSPENYNFNVGMIHGVLREAETYAREVLARDPEFIDWKLERGKKIQQTRETLPGVELERYNQRVNKQLGL